MVGFGESKGVIYAATVTCRYASLLLGGGIERTVGDADWDSLARSECKGGDVVDFDASRVIWRFSHGCNLVGVKFALFVSPNRTRISKRNKE